MCLASLRTVSNTEADGTKAEPAKAAWGPGCMLERDRESIHGETREIQVRPAAQLLLSRECWSPGLWEVLAPGKPGKGRRGALCTSSANFL